MTGPLHPSQKVVDIDLRWVHQLRASWPSSGPVQSECRNLGGGRVKRFNMAAGRRISLGDLVGDHLIFLKFLVHHAVYFDKVLRCIQKAIH